jgi:hypothetical protein
MSKCFFRCTYEVAELGRPLRDTDELEFRFDKPRSLVVRLGKAYPDQRNPVDTTNAVCTSGLSEEVIDEKMIAELTRTCPPPANGWITKELILARWRLSMAW